MHYIAEYGAAAHCWYKESAAPKEVISHLLAQWQKYQANERLGVRDQKLRPAGTPPRDMSFSNLGLAAADFSQPDRIPSAFLQNARFRLQPVAEGNADLPVSIVLHGRSQTTILDVPHGTTLLGLAELGVLTRRDPRAFRLRLNGREPASHFATLSLGDIVEVLPAEDLEGLGGSGGMGAAAPESEVYRREFEIYHANGKTTTARLKGGRLTPLAA